jgi:hypothetical protein
MKRIILFTTFFVLLVPLISACSESVEQSPTPWGTNPPVPPGGGEWGPAPHPDLRISEIQVFPAQPQSGQPFTINVYVANEGEAPSGEYDLYIGINDVSQGLSYPLESDRRGGLQPGENVPVYSSQNVMVNYPGSHQVWVEVVPWQFEDGNDNNNTAGWQFTVK